MKVIEHLNGTTRDITEHQVGQCLSQMAAALHELGDDPAGIIEAIEAACDAESHPLMLDHAELEGGTLHLWCDDAEAAAEQGAAWLAGHPDIPPG